MDDGHDFDMLRDGALLDRVGMIAAGDRGFDSVESDANGVRAAFAAVAEVSGWISRVMRIDCGNPEDMHALLGGVAALEELLASCRRLLDDRAAALAYEAGE
jgi:hypothetical protein